MLVDLDDVIDVRDDGTGIITREVWDIIQSLGGYAEVSQSMTGAHVFVKGNDSRRRRWVENNRRSERVWARRELRLPGQWSSDRDDLAAH